METVNGCTVVPPSDAPGPVNFGPAETGGAYVVMMGAFPDSMSRSSDRLRSPGEGPRQTRPTTPGDHHAEVPAPQALPRRPGAAPFLPPDGSVGTRGRGGAHGLPQARQRAA